MRLISHSEASMVLDCQAKHDFAYVGHLAGSALQPLNVAPQLRDGRAWGAAVAAYHSADHTAGAEAVRERMLAALDASLDEDAEKQRDAGLYMPGEHAEARELLNGVLAHYVATTERLVVERLEEELIVPLPSRGGGGRSNRYRLQVLFDGVTRDKEGRLWIVEYKLRRDLSSFEQIVLSRQIRWYAWAWREVHGEEPAGVIVDERKKAVPAQPKLNQDGTPSKQQSCTPEAYIEACRTAVKIKKKDGLALPNPMEPDPDVLQGLRDRRWQQREPVLLRSEEIDEVGPQLVSVAQQLNDFDKGRLYPVRNPQPQRCPGCAFRDICPTPNDQELVEALYKRVPAKKDREAAASA